MACPAHANDAILEVAEAGILSEAVESYYWRIRIM